MTTPTSLLIVDDEPAVRNLMARWAESLGLQAHTASSADEAIASLKTRPCDLAVIDVMMPGKNGLWLAGEVRRDHPQTAVVLATGYTELLGGAVAPIADLLVKPFKRERFAKAVDRGREWSPVAVEEIEWLARLSSEADERLARICEALQAPRDAEEDEERLLMTLAADRSTDVAEHAERVVRFSLAIAREMELPDTAQQTIERAARLHDIGKLATPDPLLLKPSPLTPGEVGIMRRHVTAGADMLAMTTTLREIAPLVRASHEWFNGGGYPDRLAGTAIPLASRVIAVADGYDAMTQDRAYRSRLDSTEAIAELLRCALTQFDPDIVAAFLSILGRH